MKTRSHQFLLLFSCFILMLPAVAYADFSFLWNPPQDDQSIKFLGNIFGTVGNVLNGSGSPLIADLFKIFNIAVLSIGSIVVSYTIIISTINTAQEGEIMGRKWSSVWIPLRCAIGMVFLLPTSSGYSLIQLLMMQVTIFGVAAADQIWSVAVNSISEKAGQNSSVYMNQSQVNTAINGIFQAQVCQQVFMTDPSCQAAINNKPVNMYVKNNKVIYGVQGSKTYGALCGAVMFSDPPKNVDKGTWYGTNTSAVELTSMLLSFPALQLISSTSTTTPDESLLSSAASMLMSMIGNIPLQNPPPTTNSENANLGWLYAGSFYFEFVTGGATTLYPAPVYTEGDTTSVGNACTEAYNNYMVTAFQYMGTSSGGAGGGWF